MKHYTTYEKTNISIEMSTYEKHTHDEWCGINKTTRKLITPFRVAYIDLDTNDNIDKIMAFVNIAMIDNITPQLNFNIVDFRVDSFLSEFGVLGFEYGYSQADPKTLVLWEAQFGDFSNGAQIIIDQFITTGERKWLRMSGLTLLLPHGHEGQGPEHTSSRLERFLLMCAEDNIQVANCTSPANYFHILRRQLLRDFRKPLVMMTPKSTLRHKKNISSIDDFINGSSFHRILTDKLSARQYKETKRLVLCSGKIYFELQDYINELTKENISIIRIEQLYPFPYQALIDEIKNFSHCEIIWCQEEPKNMGAWEFIRSRIENVLKKIGSKQKNIPFVGRRASASPATGVFERHLANQKNILRLSIDADMNEIENEKDGVSLIKYKLPIE